MRKVNVFGKKISRVRPLYVFVFTLALVIAAHLIIRTMQNNALSQHQQEAKRLETIIDNLIAENQIHVVHEIDEGMIYAGFESHMFNYYLQQNIDLLLAMSHVSLESRLMSIHRSSQNPLSASVSRNLDITRIELQFYVTDFDQLVVFIDALHAQNQLYYIDTFRLNQLVDSSYRVVMTLYVFQMEG